MLWSRTTSYNTNVVRYWCLPYNSVVPTPCFVSRSRLTFFTNTEMYLNPSDFILLLSWRLSRVNVSVSSRLYSSIFKVYITGIIRAAVLICMPMALIIQNIRNSVQTYIIFQGAIVQNEMFQSELQREHIRDRVQSSPRQRLA